MPTVRLIISDVREALARMIADGDTYDLLVTSPPFLALRSYLPADHPDKAREIGSEPTPAAFLDTLYGLTADWGRLLPEWASICVELGDTMSSSGGAGGDYNLDGLREGQPKFKAGSRTGWHRSGDEKSDRYRALDAVDSGSPNGGPGWPLAKSMCILPHAYTLGLAYGLNPLTGQPSPAGQWRIRNVITWARPNPPVGSLGKRNPVKRTGDYKFRPACSYITVACRGTGRYFDLDAVRTDYKDDTIVKNRRAIAGAGHLNFDRKNGASDVLALSKWELTHAGAPPLDWHRDGIDGDGLFTLEQHQPPSSRRRTTIRRNDPRRPLLSYITVACRGTGRYFDLNAVRTEPGIEVTGGSSATKHAERVRARTGYRPVANITSHEAGAPPLDWHTDHLDGDWLWKLATAPYPGAHYATYPLTLPRRLILAMCPSAVCLVCGWPRERVTAQTGIYAEHRARARAVGDDNAAELLTKGLSRVTGRKGERVDAEYTTLGFTDCGHDNYRPGRVIDCFGGSGTTAVAAALEGRDCTLIDLDPRNVDLIRRRLAEALHITTETHDGDVWTWTVEAPLPDQRQQVDGQANLFDLEAL